jgi:putative transposase
MDRCTRRLVGVGVQCGAVTGVELCRLFNASIHVQGVSRHLSTDHDPLFETHRWRANLPILEIDEVETVPHMPLAHPFVERLIGTLRWEFLDHTLFWNARDLACNLAAFQTYDNEAAAMRHWRAGPTPLAFASDHTLVPADRNDVRWVSHCRDLASSQSPPDNEFETEQWTLRKRPASVRDMQTFSPEIGML